MISSKTAETLEFNIVKEKLAGKTVSDMGKELALELMPSNDRCEVLLMMEQNRNLSQM